MPCYNECKTIRKNIFKTVNTLKNSNNGSYELIVIDDGSSDKTFKEIIAGARDNDFVKSIQLKENQGKGRALREGFQYAEGKYICFLDGDLDIHPRLIKTFFDYMAEKNADVVIGSKRHPLSKVIYPIHRKILSFGYQSFIKILFRLSIMDSQVGIKLFKRKVLDEVFPRILVKDYAFDIELLVNAHRNGYKIVEAPIEMDFQTAGITSEVSPFAYISMFIDTCAIFYRTNILRYYDNGFKDIEMNYQTSTMKLSRLKDKSKNIVEVIYHPYEIHESLIENKNESGKLVSKMKLDE